MTKTMKIEGMMCVHCEARVKKALEELDGVAEARPDHDAGIAELTLTGRADDATLKKTVEALGFTVTGIT